MLQKTVATMPLEEACRTVERFRGVAQAAVTHISQHVATRALNNHVAEWALLLLVLAALRSADLRPQHWITLAQVIG